MISQMLKIGAADKVDINIPVALPLCYHIAQQFDGVLVLSHIRRHHLFAKVSYLIDDCRDVIYDFSV